MVLHTDTLVLTSAVAHPTARLAQVLNEAYADYYVPVWFSRYQFEQMCDDMDVDLTRSVVAMVENKPVGIALLSLRGDEGWISGVGVIPEWRRRGVGRAIILRLQEIARQAGLSRLRLEVLRENEGGRRLYEERGFTWYRELLVLSMAPDQTLPPQEALPLLRSRPQSLLQHYTDLHRVEPSWQLALPSLRKRADRLQGLGLWLDDVLVGYILYQAQSDVCHVLDLAVDPSRDAQVSLARGILLSLHSLYPGSGGYIINVPAEDPVLAAFNAAGYHIWHRQDEMVWQVPRRPPAA